MTAQIIRLEPSAHRVLQDLLPWYATGTLARQESEQVAAHLESCPECQAELAFHQKLAGHRESTPTPDEVQHSWERLAPALEPPSRAPLEEQARRWVPWALAAQLVLVLGFGAIVLIPKSAPAVYHTLSAAPAPTFRVVLMVEPQTTELELRTLVRSAGLRIVDGPTANGAYVLEGSRSDEPAALHVLRAGRAALVVEPLDTSSNER